MTRPSPLAVAVCGAAVMLPLFLLPTATATALAGLLHVAALGAAIVLMLRSARGSDSPMRRPRLLLALSMTTSACGSLIGVGYVMAQGSIPVPSLVDPVTLLWVPLAAWGFWSVPVRDGGLLPTRRLIADGAVVASALLFVAWITVLEPITANSRWSLPGEIVQLSYPVFDVFIITIVLSLPGPLPVHRACPARRGGWAMAGLCLGQDRVG